ncbi:MAG: glycosyltransferase [Tumebacillaceae bacterium]
MDHHTISLCMIVKDEEQYIERCLASSAPHVDEIIIVDTGSTDGTLNIVKRFGAKIFPLQWSDDFSVARNHALQQATSDYILVLDADEYLDAETDLQKELAFDHDSYALSFKNYLSNGLVLYHKVIRLFKNRIGLNYYGRIHEHLNVEQLGIYTSQTNILVHHDGYTQEMYEKKGKHERNFQLLVQLVDESPTGYNMFNLATQYRLGGQHDQAVHWYQRAYSLSKDRVHIISLLYNLVDSLRLLHRYKEALSVVREAIQAHPFFTDLYYVQGRIYEEAGYWPDAIASYKKCVELGDVKQDLAFHTLEGVGGYLAHYRLGETYTLSGRKADALEQAFHAFRKNRRFLSSLHLYQRLILEARIPLDQAYVNLNSILELSSIQQMQEVVSVLYALRHPLLERFVNENKLPIDSHLRATAKQYAGHYEEARSHWQLVEAVPETVVTDIILLAMLLRDESLLDRVRSTANLSKREWQVIKKALQREGGGGAMTGELETLFLTLCKHAIVLKEYDLFEILSGYVVQGSVKVRLELAKILIDYQFTDIAFDLLADLFEQKPTNIEVLDLLGGLCLQLERYGDALNLFLRAVELKPEYRYFYNIYTYYQKTQDAQGMRNVLDEMQRRFPESVWVWSQTSGLPFASL